MAVPGTGDIVTEWRWGLAIPMNQGPVMAIMPSHLKRSCSPRNGTSTPLNKGERTEIAFTIRKSSGRKWVIVATGRCHVEDKGEKRYQVEQGFAPRYRGVPEFFPWLAMWCIIPSTKKLKHLYKP
jgi:hypothetical protein